MVWSGLCGVPIFFIFFLKVQNEKTSVIWAWQGLAKKKEMCQGAEDNTKDYS